MGQKLSLCKMQGLQMVVEDTRGGNGKGFIAFVMKSSSQRKGQGNENA